MFDLSRQTFRLEEYAEYKAGRSATPTEFSGQIPLVHEVLDALRIRYIEAPGYEADDIIATLTTEATAQGMEVVIVSGDRDVFQLVADDVTMVIVPDLITAATREDGSLDLGLWTAVQTSLISPCEQNGNRMAVLDAPPGMTPQQIRDWRSDVAMSDSACAALYYPWIDVMDPLSNRPMLVPPSGHVAGIWCRTDATRGVHKAPANEVALGANGLAFQVTHAEQGGLNQVGIN